MKEVYERHKSGYLVSNYGNIKGKAVEYLKNTLTSAGYHACSCGLVHRIVVETFLGEIPEKMEVHHIDGCKTNNRLDNLQIVTASQNQKYHKQSKSYKTIEGEKNPLSTVSESDVLEMYAMFKHGNTNQEVAVKYQLHDRYVSLIRHGKRWKHLWSSHFDGRQHTSLGNSVLALDDMIKVLHMITKTNMTNDEIASIYFLDKSTISKVRHKRGWKEIWRIYLQRNSIATTIETTEVNTSGRE